MKPPSNDLVLVHLVVYLESSTLVYRLHKANVYQLLNCQLVHLKEPYKAKTEWATLPNPVVHYIQDLY